MWTGNALILKAIILGVILSSLFAPISALGDVQSSELVSAGYWAEWGALFVRSLASSLIFGITTIASFYGLQLRSSGRFELGDNVVAKKTTTTIVESAASPKVDGIKYEQV